MGAWNEYARREAARHWGRRHWRWYLAAHVARILAPALAPVAVALAAAAGVWTLARVVDWGAALRAAAAVLAVALVAWLAGQVVTGAGIRRRLAGQREPRWPALALGGVVVLLVASLLVR
jgi:hypothetical protein